MYILIIGAFRLANIGTKEFLDFAYKVFMFSCPGINLFPSGLCMVYTLLSFSRRESWELNVRCFDLEWKGLLSHENHIVGVCFVDMFCRGRAGHLRARRQFLLESRFSECKSVRGFFSHAVSTRFLIRGWKQ